MQNLAEIINQIPTPCYVLERDKLIQNLKILDCVQKQSGAKILLALKGYAFWRCFEELREVLAGSTASGSFEAKLGFEEIGGAHCGKEVCVFSPAYKEIHSILPYATHIIFNSFAQWQKFKSQIDEHNAKVSKFCAQDCENPNDRAKNRAPNSEFSESKAQDCKNPTQDSKISQSCPPKNKISVGLRVNPLYSEIETQIYNPCAAGSRLGITPKEFKKGVRKFGLSGIDGLHFHTHCEQNSDALKHTLPHFEKHFGKYLRALKEQKSLKWINFGGGHHITRADYDTKLLIKLAKKFRQKYDCEIFIEPGEAVGWQVGFLVAQVVDIVKNKGEVAILDSSFSAHMPDCLEMPYKPAVAKISESKKLEFENDKDPKCAKFKYIFGGPTCLAGDHFGKFGFDTPLQIGDKIIFKDMLHYTIVKNNTFNGVPLPSLGVIERKNDKQIFRILKEFDYLDYKNRN